MFGKAMSISDEVMKDWRAMLGTAYGLSEPGPEHPMEAKKELAGSIIARFHGAEAAQKARTDFEDKFSKKNLESAEIPDIAVSENPIWVIKLLQEIKAAASSSDARRLVQQGGVKLNGEKVTDVQAKIDVSGNPVLQSGKKFFARLRG